MGLWARFKKDRAVRAYLREGPALLRKRYGYEEQYSPGRVVATLTADRLSLEFAEYACALFATEESFVEWVVAERERSTGEQRSTNPLVRTEIRRHYRELREEVSERYTNGNRVFLPKSHLPSDVAPVENTSYQSWSGFKG
jgi:hypothetical protein